MKKTRAFSYVRFSSSAQEKGDSLRRQTQGSESYAKRKGYLLDDSLNLLDLGVSAFRGANVREGSLSAFLEAIRMGRVPPGSVLIVESLDRLTRDQLSEALTLFMDILRMGVRIATLTPEREYSKDSLNDIAALLEPLIIFVRAHEESKTKSERLCKAWQAKRTRLDKKILTSVCPCWCRPTADRTGFELVPKRAAVVRQIFTWAIEGIGVNVITRRLNQSVPPIGRADTWHRSYVLKILRNRAAIGEYQPHRGHGAVGRQPVGKAIPDYYPAVVEAELFYRVQAALKSRRLMRGRTGKSVANLFTGLLHDARDQASLTMINKDGRQLVSAKAARGVPGSQYLPFSYGLFERAFLDFVRDLTPADVLPPKTSHQQAELSRLATRLGELEHKIDRTKAKIATAPDVDALLDVLTTLEWERQAVAGEQEQAKAQATVDEAALLQEAKSLVQRLAETKGEALFVLRSRLRQRIRALVAAIWVVVWDERLNWHPLQKERRPKFRFVEVQVRFVTGETQFFFLETRSNSFYGPPFKGEKLADIPPEDRERARRYDLTGYSGWYDTPFQLNPDWPSMWRFFGMQTVVVRMRAQSRDQRLSGQRRQIGRQRKQRSGRRQVHR